MKKQFEVRVSHRRSEQGEKVLIVVRKPDGSQERYQHPDELPPELRKFVEPLLTRSPLNELPARCFDRSTVEFESDSQLDEETNQRRQRQRRELENYEPLVIVHRWFSASFLITLAILIGVILAASLLPEPEYRVRRRVNFGNTGSLILFFAILLPLLYLWVANLLNRTIITVTRQGLQVRHKPLPWLGNRFIPAVEIKQIFVKLRRYRRGCNYSLCALTNSGEVTLIGGAFISSPLQLLRYERQIENWLGIEDWPVYGTDFRFD
jgi:hypothetical protein